jgi:protein-disulfide isomerase
VRAYLDFTCVGYTSLVIYVKLHKSDNKNKQQIQAKTGNVELIKKFNKAFALFVFFTAFYGLFADAVAQSYMIPGRAPKITIGGQQVLTNKQIRNEAVNSDLPEELQHDRARMAIENRRRLQIWNHNPMRGPKEAPVVFLEITDLSCLYCQDLSKEIDKVFKKEKFKGQIQHYVMHLPVDSYNLTNAAAFYSRLAFDANYFWEYRKNLFDVSSATDNIFIEKLLSIGLEEKEIRRMTRKNARRYYRELDADSTAAKSLGEMRPPALYVNGIKIGGSITLKELEPLVDYEIKLYEKRQ